jgi:hypothetical protein
MVKIHLSNVRMYPINIARQKLIDIVLGIYRAAMERYKKYTEIPDSIMTIFSTALGILKTYHSQPDLINNTHALDKMLGERNFLQCAGPN